MNRLIVLAAVLGAVEGNISVMGQRTSPPPPPPAAGVAQKTVMQPPSPVIAELSVAKGSMTVGKLLPILQEKAPGFEYVIEPGPWQDAEVPDLKLHEVSLIQVISILSTFCPTLSYTTVGGGDRQPVYVFRNRTMGGNADIRVQAFGISAIVDRLAARADGTSDRAKFQKARQDTLQHVLSLIENTLNQTAEPGMKATVSFHAETETVLVRGSGNQINSVRQALETFQPLLGVVQADRLNDQLREARATVDSLHSELLKREAEIVELKIRLESAQRKNEADSKH